MMKRFFGQRSRQSNQTGLQESAYFESARSWAEEFQIQQSVSRARYQKAFFAMVVLVGVLVFGLVNVTSKYSTQLMVVHEGIGGYSWVSTAKVGEIPAASWAKTRAEIAHYVASRESYDPILYSQQAETVKALSDPAEMASYELSQSPHQKDSPVNILGARGYRTVQILNVMALDKMPDQPVPGRHHENLAQVSFVQEDHFLESNEIRKTPFTALISWRYDGVSQDAGMNLKNWDGFKVIRYNVERVV